MTNADANRASVSAIASASASVSENETEDDDDSSDDSDYEQTQSLAVGASATTTANPTAQSQSQSQSQSHSGPSPLLVSHSRYLPPQSLTAAALSALRGRVSRARLPPLAALAARYGDCLLPTLRAKEGRAAAASDRAAAAAAVAREAKKTAGKAASGAAIGENSSDDDDEDEGGVTSLYNVTHGRRLTAAHGHGSGHSRRRRNNPRFDPDPRASGGFVDLDAGAALHLPRQFVASLLACALFGLVGQPITVHTVQTRPVAVNPANAGATANSPDTAVSKSPGSIYMKKPLPNNAASNSPISSSNAGKSKGGSSNSTNANKAGYYPHLCFLELYSRIHNRRIASAHSGDAGAAYGREAGDWGVIGCQVAKLDCVFQYFLTMRDRMRAAVAAATAAVNATAGAQSQSALRKRARNLRGIISVYRHVLTVTSDTAVNPSAGTAGADSSNAVVMSDSSVPMPDNVDSVSPASSSLSSSASKTVSGRDSGPTILTALYCVSPPETGAVRAAKAAAVTGLVRTHSTMPAGASASTPLAPAARGSLQGDGFTVSRSLAEYIALSAVNGGDATTSAATTTETAAVVPTPDLLLHGQFLPHRNANALLPPISFVDGGGIEDVVPAPITIPSKGALTSAQHNAISCSDSSSSSRSDAVVDAPASATVSATTAPQSHFARTTDAPVLTAPVEFMGATYSSDAAATVLATMLSRAPRPARRRRSRANSDSRGSSASASAFYDDDDSDDDYGDSDGLDDVDENSADSTDNANGSQASSAAPRAISLASATPVQTIHADFANKFLGGGVLRSGAVQEEILFLIKPECLVTLAVAERLDPKEVVYIVGAERFSSYTGYSRSFAFAGPYVDPTPYDAFGRVANAIVAVDALAFHSPQAQFTFSAVRRELLKALAAFSFPVQTLAPAPLEQLTAPFVLASSSNDAARSSSSSSSSSGAIAAAPMSDSSSSSIAVSGAPPFPLPPPFTHSTLYSCISTGNWGCGAFGGDVALKLALQWVAAGLCDRSLLYHTFAVAQAEAAPRFVAVVRAAGLTVRGLWLLVHQYCAHVAASKQVTVIGDGSGGGGAHGQSYGTLGQGAAHWWGADTPQSKKGIAPLASSNNSDANMASPSSVAEDLAPDGANKSSSSAGTSASSLAKFGVTVTPQRADSLSGISAVTPSSGLSALSESRGIKRPLDLSDNAVKQEQETPAAINDSDAQQQQQQQQPKRNSPAVGAPAVIASSDVDGGAASSINSNTVVKLPSPAPVSAASSASSSASPAAAAAKAKPARASVQPSILSFFAPKPQPQQQLGQGQQQQQKLQMVSPVSLGALSLNNAKTSSSVNPDSGIAEVKPEAESEIKTEIKNETETALVAMATKTEAETKTDAMTDSGNAKVSRTTTETAIVVGGDDDDDVLSPSQPAVTKPLQPGALTVAATTATAAVSPAEALARAAFARAYNGSALATGTVWPPLRRFHGEPERGESLFDWVIRVVGGRTVNSHCGHMAETCYHKGKCNLL